MGVLESYRRGETGGWDELSGCRAWTGGQSEGPGLGVGARTGGGVVGVRGRDWGLRVQGQDPGI